MADPDNVIGIAVVESQDGYTPIMRVGSSILRDLMKLMAPYKVEEYELGTLVKPNGDKILVLKPLDQDPDRVDAGFVLAGMIEPTVEVRAEKAISDPTQTQIPGVEA
jgi:hypothetical protein